VSPHLRGRQALGTMCHPHRSTHRLDVVLIQDGDLKCNPVDYRRLVGPLLRGEADVAYGNRLQEGRGRLYGWF